MMSRVHEHRGPLTVLAGVAVLLAGFALTVDYPRTAGSFWSDAATYYTMAHSLAEDGDLRFAREDVERVFEEFESGPSGIFLKKGRELDLTLTGTVPFLVSEGPLTNDLYYGKAFLYSLAAAPLVALWGTNGMLLLHALLFSAVLVAGYFFLAARNPRGVALAFTLTFFFASVAPAYFVWLTPELFNLALVFFGGFFWLYKEVAESPPRWLAGPRLGRDRRRDLGRGHLLQAQQRLLDRALPRATRVAAAVGPGARRRRLSSARSSAVCSSSTFSSPAT